MSSTQVITKSSIGKLNSSKSNISKISELSIKPKKKQNPQISNKSLNRENLLLEEPISKKTTNDNSSSIGEDISNKNTRKDITTALDQTNEVIKNLIENAHMKVPELDDKGHFKKPIKKAAELSANKKFNRKYQKPDPKLKENVERLIIKKNTTTVKYTKNIPIIQPVKEPIIEPIIVEPIKEPPKPVVEIKKKKSVKKIEPVKKIFKIQRVVDIYCRRNECNEIKKKLEDFDPMRTKRFLFRKRCKQPVNYSDYSCDSNLSKEENVKETKMQRKDCHYLEDDWGLAKPKRKSENAVN